MAELGGARATYHPAACVPPPDERAGSWARSRPEADRGVDLPRLPAPAVPRTWLRRRAPAVGVAGGVVGAVVLAWVTLVQLRWPERALDAGTVLSMDASLTRSLVADRILSVVTWAENAATLLVVGGALYRAFVRRPHPRARGLPERLLVTAAAVGLAACVGTLPVRAMVLSGNGPAAVVDMDVMRVVLMSRFGDAACLRLLGLGIFAVTLVHPPPGWERRIRVIRPEGTLLVFGSIARGTMERAAHVAGALVAVASFTLVGHPQATEPRGLLVASQAVHVLAAAVWFGGGVLLALEIREQRQHGSARCTAETVARFSVVAGGAVVLVGTSGLVLAASQLTSVGGLVSTAYGRALSVKLALVAVVASLGAYNHHRLVPAIVGRDEAMAWRLLARTAALEGALIAAGVLIATAAMTSGGF